MRVTNLLTSYLTLPVAFLIEEHVRYIHSRLVKAGQTHEISPINAQGVVSEGRVRRQARCMNLKLIN